MGSVPKNNFALYLESDKGFLTLVKQTLVVTTRPSTDIKQKGSCSFRNRSVPQTNYTIIQVIYYEIRDFSGQQGKLLTLKKTNILKKRYSMKVGQNHGHNNMIFFFFS